MSDFALALAFDTNEGEFARGFEAGNLWNALKAHDGPLEALIHTCNTEMVLRMAEATNREAISSETAEPWMQVSFGEVGSKVLD